MTRIFFSFKISFLHTAREERNGRGGKKILSCTPLVQFRESVCECAVSCVPESKKTMSIATKMQTTKKRHLKKEDLLFHVVSLKECKKRRRELDRLDKGLRLQYHLFDRHPQRGMAGAAKGCTDSHVSLYRYCVKNDLPYICVMEDDPRKGQHFDAFWTSKASESLYKLLFETDSNDWPCEVILLGSGFFLETRCCPCKDLKGLYYTYNGNHSALCYIISQRACKEMIHAYEAGEMTGRLLSHIDRTLCAKTRQLLVKPILFQHQNNESTIFSVGQIPIGQIDPHRMLFFSKRGNRFSENWYYNNVLYTMFLIFRYLVLLAMIYAVVAMLRYLFPRKIPLEIQAKSIANEEFA